MRLALCLMILMFSVATTYADMAGPKMEQFTRIEIYYYGWDVLTRSRLSLDTIRRNSKIHITILDQYEMGQFAKWARFDEMEDVDVPHGVVVGEDPRLVIDLYEHDGKRVTYYASKFNLLSEDSKKRRRIDERFRRKFSFSPDRGGCGNGNCE